MRAKLTRNCRNTLMLRHFTPPVVLDDTGRPHPIWACGAIADGTWQTKTEPYNPEHSDLYKALFSRYFYGTPWSKTAHFQKCLRKISQGQRTWNGCASHEDLLQATKRADFLIESIRSRGFLPSRDPVLICVTSNGEIVKRGNGQHRIMLAKMLGHDLPVLPVIQAPRNDRYKTLRTHR